MEDSKKMTLDEFYDEVIMLMEHIEGYARADEMKEIALNKKAQIANKRAKAAEKAAEAKAAGDALRAVVEGVLTAEWQTLEEVTAQVEGEDITPGKVRARLSQLVQAGVAEKQNMKEKDGKMCYRLA